MSKMWVMGIAFVLLLIAFPLISFGTTGDNPTLWWAGVALLVLGGLVPPVTRYVFADQEEEKDEEEAEREEARERAPADTEPAEIRVVRRDGGEPERPGDGEQAAGEVRKHEELARAHEERAEAHREQAKAHEERARAEEKRADPAERKDRDKEER